jgi:hypothetical protein
MAECGKLIDEMTTSGVLVEIAPLRPSREGVRLRWNKGKLSRVDGPFTEAKEVVGSYGIFEAKSLDEAIEHVKRFLALLGDEGSNESEIRQLDGPG